uniref:Transmembrane protein n=1 Tax=Cacopsylla melanoneura TaxID=428564 RepID=A0A8D8VS23_9HEMI
MAKVDRISLAIFSVCLFVLTETASSYRTPAIDKHIQSSAKDGTGLFGNSKLASPETQTEEPGFFKSAMRICSENLYISAAVWAVITAVMFCCCGCSICYLCIIGLGVPVAFAIWWFWHLFNTSDNNLG